MFLLDFDGDLYGQTIDVDFRARLRDVIRFHSVDQLLEQMNRDVQETRQIAVPDGPPDHPPAAG